MSRYAERLYAPVWVWVVLLLLAGSLALAFGAAAGVGVGLLTGLVGVVGVGWGLHQAAARLVVTDETFVAGRARIPLSAVGAVRPLDADQTRALRGPEADPRAYLLVRGWVPTSVYVEVADSADPTPYWLVATRHPDALARALSAGRPESIRSD